MHARRRFRHLGALSVVALLSMTMLSACSSSSPSSGSSGKVLTVGTYKGIKGQFTTIQAAVSAAKPGDWVLVAPGDYKEADDLSATPTHVDRGGFGGVLVTTSGIHIRGLSRSGVIVDGTKPGAPACSSNASDQQYGSVQDGKAIGRNGIVVYKANHVSVDNLTVCNFLSGSADSGNQVWWNGGADSDKIGLHGYTGSYLSATSSFYGGESTAATYGIFSSAAAGDGAHWTQLYASNMNDSGMYVGACMQVCGITIDHVDMEYSALGYSGTNSGGAIVIEDSLFANNKDGFDTNTQIRSDPPAPQNGACPNNGISPITHTHSCWVLRHNVFANNNNPNVPQSGGASYGPVGTGMTLSGGHNDTVINNVFKNNDAWGFLMVPFPDSDSPSFNQTCTGAGGVETPGLGCVFDPINDKLANNTFVSNGSFGNPTNGDFGQLALNANEPSNCFSGNHTTGAVTPANLEAKYPTCGVKRAAPDAPADLLNQALCNTGFSSCPAGTIYPRVTQIVMHPLPKKLATMPNPCQGVPDSLWCKGGSLS